MLNDFCIVHGKRFTLIQWCDKKAMKSKEEPPFSEYVQHDLHSLKCFCKPVHDDKNDKNVIWHRYE